MEISFEGITMSLVVMVLLSYGWKMLNWVWFKPKKLEKLLRAQGLQGTPYSFLFGDSGSMIKMWIESRQKPIDLNDDVVPRVLPFQHYLVKKHGKNSFCWIGPKPMLHVLDPKLLSEIMTKNVIYTKPVISPLQGLLLDGLVLYNGDKWSKHRKIMNPAFHLQKLKAILPAMHFCCNEMIENWESNFIGETKSCELDVAHAFKILSSDVIARTAFGSNYKEGNQIFHLQRELADIVGHILFSAYIPGWKFIPTKRNKRMKQVNNELRALVSVVVEKRKKSLSKGEISEDDLLGLLLRSSESQVRESGNNKAVGLSIEDIVQECRLFFFAGQEATGYLMTWTMVLLSMHQDWQVKAREEVLQVFGNSTPDYTGLSRLPIVTMILNEVLRLYPPAALIPRSIEKDTILGGMNIPAGTTFVLPILQIHRDPELWGEDANEFKPERFSQGIAKATQTNFSYFPFGWGHRLCIGTNFGLLETKLAIALILQRFSFELSPSYTHAPTLMLILQAQYGTPLILRKL